MLQLCLSDWNPVSVFGMKHLRRLHLLPLVLLLHLFAAVRPQVNPGLCSERFISACCAVALLAWDGWGPPALPGSSGPLSGSNQNKVLGLLLNLYQMLASKNPELAAVYQPVFCRQAEFSPLLKG